MGFRDFCYWLQGKLEIDGKAGPLTAEQVEVIRRHLQLVFTNVTAPVAVPPVQPSPATPVDSGSPLDLWRWPHITQPFTPWCTSGVTVDPKTVTVTC